MTYIVFDKREPSPLRHVADDSEWTSERLEDEFFLCLVKTPKDKYYEQAKNLIFRIPLTNQYQKSEQDVTLFTISFDDLSSRVQSEFREYCSLNNRKCVGLFLKVVVIRLFENLDFEYAHMSVMRKLRIKVVKS